MQAVTEIPKAYEPAAVEAKWQERWTAARCFLADPARVAPERPAFSIVMPPPNITGVLTLGHVLNNTIQDVLARRARMTGHEVLWLPGTDHAGLATQTAVERALRKEEKLTRHDLGREEFLRRTWEWREKHGRTIVEQLKRLGCSCDWSRERFTLDSGYAAAVQRVFVSLYDKGYIYRGKRMVNWDPAALTALSDEEVIPTPQKSVLYYVRYEVVDEPGRFIEIATTRPETIMADTALAVHPADERYASLIGRQVWRPFPREAIPVIGDEQIDPKFGTGALKVTPAHDKVDFEIGQRHHLPIIDILHPNGTINCPAAPALDGLDRFAARKKAAELLAEAGLLSKEEPYENSVGFSERAGVPIEPRLSEQWFLRYPKTGEALRVVREHLIRFFPAHWEKVYGQWLENIQDWCISRQVWWGHRVPAWYRAVEPGHKLEDAAAGSLFMGDTEIRVQIDSPGEEWTQDADTLDTWFSSWLWAYETMDAETRAKFYPTDVLVTGPDIIFFWVARMIIAGLEFQPGVSGRDEDNIPFRNVYFTGLIRDKSGKKMSKSLGNSPDVLELIAKYGADGLRFGLLRIAPQGQDIRFDEKQIEEGRNFANKIWNAARFYQMQETTAASGDVKYEPAPYVLDIQAKLCKTIQSVKAAYAEFKFSEVAQLLYDFYWSDYCDWFVEAAKSDILLADGGEPNEEAKAGKNIALSTMLEVQKVFFKLLHPFMPHLTEELWSRLSPEASELEGEKTSFLAFQDVAERFEPSAEGEKVAAAQELTERLYESVRIARNLRAEYQVASNKMAKFVLRLRNAERMDGRDGRLVLRVFARMTNAEELRLDLGYSPPRGTPSALTPFGELFMPLAGLVDVEAERARIQKELAKAEADLQAAARKLESQQFVNNAPAAVVLEHRQRRVDASARLAKLNEMLAALGES